MAPLILERHQTEEKQGWDGSYGDDPYRTWEVPGRGGVGYDNDGYQDVLNISYSLDAPGKVANVFIYDSKGRQIKHLIKNEHLSQEGVFCWNGINDENEKAAIGIYIVYAEIFSLSNGKINKYKMTCTLAGRL